MVPFKRFLSKYTIIQLNHLKLKLKEINQTFHYKRDIRMMNISSSLIDQRINFRDPVGSSKQEQVVEMIEG